MERGTKRQMTLQKYWEQAEPIDQGPKSSEQRPEMMNIVVVGHVDHGKSTIIGRLLADTESLPEGKLEQVRNTCQRNSKPFEYAFLIDALKDEQAQGITIDSARVFFKTNKRKYIIIDAPGHIEFLKNMVTGASRAEAALLVIDASEGIQENSKRHSYMLSMLGIKQIAVLVNKMDRVAYSEDVFKRIVEEYSNFLSQINLAALCFIPVSGARGDNIAVVSSQMPWYKGKKSVLEIIDIFRKEKEAANQPFRMPVQDVYKFTKSGDNRRIIAGSIETGSIKVGDEIVFYPSGKKNKVKSIEIFNKPAVQRVAAGLAVGLTLVEQIYVKRGEVAVRINEPKPKVTSRLRVSLFWLGREPMLKGKDYFLKVGTTKVSVRLESIDRVIDASNLKVARDRDKIGRHDVAECILKVNRDIAFDLVGETAGMSRFVIVDNYEIAGGGIIRQEMEDKQGWLRNKILLRNYKWERSNISEEERAERYNQRAALVLITGNKKVDKKIIAKKLEAKLFVEGRVVYFLGIGNILYGVDADIKREESNHPEHIRRLAEVINILLDAGVILIVTATQLRCEDMEIIRMAVSSEKIEVIWVGPDVAAGLDCSLQITDVSNLENVAEEIKLTLQDKGIISA